jgi:transcriptional regulator with XRE-family HTH domain
MKTADKKRRKKTSTKAARVAASADKRAASRPPADTADNARVAADNRVVRSEGQRLLLAVTGTLAEIAEAVGCRSRQTVLDWRDGRKVPAAAMRARLFSVYGIQTETWSHRPTALGAVVGAALAALDEPEEEDAGSAPSTLEDCMTLLKSIRDQRNNKALLPSEIIKLTDSEGRLLALRARLEKDEEMLEDRIVREHPTWQMIKRRIVKVLVEFPDAARAVARALGEPLEAQ